VDVTYGGSIILTNVDVSTSGASSSALATDFGGGTVTVTGGTIIGSSTASNSHSAGIYSTGTISVTGASVTSLGDCGGVIDGANSILLTNTTLTGKVEGIKTWKTAPASGTATVIIDGGALIVTAGDGFYITGETNNAATASLTVKNGATINASTGKIVNVVSSSTATFTANAVTLTGNLIADSTSTITANLQDGTILQGQASRTAITLDSTSTWHVNAASALTTMANSGTVDFTAAGLTASTTGAYTQASTGTLGIKLGSASSFDRLAVTGAATLPGKLKLTLVDGYSPAVGTTFTIVTYGSKSGQFAQVTGAAAKRFTIAYNTGNIVLTAVAPARGDFNGDGDVDSDDLASFLACVTGPAVGIATGCESKDFDNDGDIDQADFGKFQRCFSGTDNPADPACAN
jgi:hypothetical protein